MATPRIKGPLHGLLTQLQESLRNIGKDQVRPSDVEHLLDTFLGMWCLAPSVADIPLHELMVALQPPPAGVSFRSPYDAALATRSDMREFSSASVRSRYGDLRGVARPVSGAVLFVYDQHYQPGYEPIIAAHMSTFLRLLGP